MTLRQALYRSASVLGDIKAIQRGRFPQRLARRVIYGQAFRLAGWVARQLGVSR